MTRFKYGVLGFTGLLLLISAMSAALRLVDSAIPALSHASALPVIIIDPGHGGADGGAVGVNGVVEKDINFAISLTLRDLFLLNGFDVVMTREEDVSIHDPGVKGLRKQKTSDLRNRLAMQSQYSDVIFISIHQNKFGDSRQKGTQVFFGPNDDRSRELANILQQNVVGMLQPDNNRKTKIGQKNLFLIYEAKCPAILVECGFLSNSGEEQKLNGSTYQAQIAFTILRSVLDYLQPQSPA